MLTRMDRSVIEVWRAGERELSEILYQKLSLLNIMHPPSEEFKKLLTEDMFLKPNQKALFHVMHYLFMLLDATEFKKRFYWPLSDKRSETMFRSSTVQYLNYLNEKHHLNWTPLKNYLVVMPGGAKFIVFLIDLMDFVVEELIKRTKKQVGNELLETKRHYKEFNLETLTKDHERFKMHYSDNAKKLIAATESKRKQVASLKIKLEEICASHEMSVQELISRSFLKEWKEYNKNIFKSHISNKRQRDALKDELNQLKLKFALLVKSKAELQYDKNSLLLSYKLFNTVKPDITLDCDHLFSRNGLNFQAIIPAFCKITPTIDKMLCEVQNNQIEKWQQEKVEIEKLLLDFMQLKNEIIEFQTLMKTENCLNVRNTPIRSVSAAESNLKTKFINTPPIYFDVKQLEVKRARLPLLEDNASQINCTITNNATFLHQNLSKPFFSTQKKKCKIVDPFTILRTVKERKVFGKKCEDLATLGPKWKERELMMENSKLNYTICSPKESLSIHINPLIQKNINIQNIAIKGNVLCGGDKIFSPDVLAYQTRNLSGTSIHESFDDFKFLRVTTSPSGRLESLVNMDDRNAFNTTNYEIDSTQIIKMETTIKNEEISHGIEKAYDAVNCCNEFSEN